MNKGLIAGIAFIAGAAIGSVVTWKVVSTRCERIANEEAQSFREELAKLRAGEETEETEEEEPHVAEVSPEEKEEYAHVAVESGYVHYSSVKKAIVEKTEPKTPETESVEEKPYVIEPDEFGTIDDYDTRFLTYYADKVLTDQWDNIIRDVENTIGRDSLNHFGEYDEPDIVHVRNERLKTDYEVAAVTTNYVSVLSAYDYIEDDE